MRGLGEGQGSLVLPRGGPGDVARNEPNPMIGCRVQQTCRGTRGENRRSREERQGRNKHEVGILGPKGGKPPGSGRAVFVSMEGSLWKTPGEELEPDVLRENGQHLRMQVARQVSREQRAMERGDSTSLKERRRSRGPHAVRHTVFRMFLDDLVVKHKDLGSLGSAGKANDPQPVCR